MNKIFPIDVSNVILKSNLPYPLIKRGKVRDIYEYDGKLIIFSSDRISAFDFVLNNGIPFKGETLNRLSHYWFIKTRKIISNHFIKLINERTSLVKKTNSIPIEFIVRGYLYGSAFQKYKNGKTISGIRIPEGLKKAEKLPYPILTPTTKSESGHDIEITRKDIIKILGEIKTKKIEDSCLKIYNYCSKQAEKKGIIIADTKFEFGILNDEVILIDEILTPDSSRFWEKSRYEIGKNQFSFDKQYVRDYLISIGWEKKLPVPKLPNEVIVNTAKKYIEAYEKITGDKFRR